MRSQRGLILVFSIVLVYWLTIFEIGAVVFFNFDNLGDEDSQKQSASASQLAYEAASDAFQMLGYVEFMKFDKDAIYKTQKLRRSIIEKLDAAIEIFSKLAEDQAFIVEVDRVILGRSTGELALSLEMAGVEPTHPLLQETIAQTSKEGSKAIFDRCIKELKEAQLQTKMHEFNIKDRENPVVIWNYIKMWNRLIFVGRSLSTLFYAEY